MTEFVHVYSEGGGIRNVSVGEGPLAIASNTNLSAELAAIGVTPMVIAQQAAIDAITHKSARYLYVASDQQWSYYRALERVVRPLFTGSVAGAWYDPTDYSSLLQDLSGTVPVTGVGQPVRLMLDKSGNGNNITFAGTTPPNTALDEKGVRILQPQDSTSRGVCASMTVASPMTVISVQSLANPATNNTFYDSYADANKSTLYQTTSTTGVIAEAGAIGLWKYGPSVPATYSILYKTGATGAWIAIDGRKFDYGNTGANGFSGLSLFNIRGNPNPITAGVHSTRPFYGMVIVAGEPTAAQVLAIEQAYRSDMLLTKPPYESIMALGDSTIVAYLGQDNVLDFITTVQEKITLAVAGSTISDQSTVYQFAAHRETASATILQIGLNDLAYAEAASVAIARLQSLVNKVLIYTPTWGKVFVAKMSPCKARLISLYGPTDGLVSYEKWLSINDAISGGGGTPITGVHGRITAHEQLLNDGNGNLRPEYDTGDGIHTNNAGRQVVAGAWQSSMVAAGVVL